MSDSNTLNSAEKLYNVQRSFKTRLASKIDDIESRWKILRDRKSTDFTEFHLLIHSLVGTSGTFGAIMVSNVSRKIEVIAKLLLNNELTLNNEIVSKLDTLFLSLRNTAIKWQPSLIPFIPEAAINDLIEEPNWVSNIFLVEDDVEIVMPLIDFLESAGYKVFYYREISEFEEAYNSHDQASAIIMDMAFKEGHIAGAKTIKRLSEKDDKFPPVIFISVHDDVEARLAAAQVGAKRYFTKPINQNGLLKSLDNLTHRVVPDAYRILLIDDEKEILDFYSDVLQQHGFETLSFINPLEAYQAIETFKPDLIILDLYMPECSGLDLAKVIRQNDEYAHIPIVFLSAELDTGTQLSAMDLGGDDFLMKPVEPSHFVQAVIARVKRSRRIRRLNKTLRDTLRESEYRLVTLDQHAIVIMADANGNISYVNKHFIKVSGYLEQDVLGENFKHLKFKSYDDIWKVISDGQVWHGQVCNLAKDGSEYWLEMTIVPFIDENGFPYKYVFSGTDVTKLKSTETALLNAKEEADRANLAKSNFLSRMSHELRTPMNAISGFSQLLKNNTDENMSAVQLNYVDEIMLASKHLLSLINEILNLSKVESGKVDMSLECINLSDVLLESLSLITPLTEKKYIELTFKFNNDFISFDDFSIIENCIKADRTRLKQVFINLLSNAVKYNHENGSITIHYETNNKNMLRINISDTGKGIAENLLPQLFTEFNRLGEEDSKTEGTGIGLMITKQLTELMGGNVGVESESGKGSTFWVEFPTCQD